MMQLSWPGRMDLIMAAQSGARDAADGCCSWPLNMGLEEECSPEEIQQMVELITQAAQQGMPGPYR